MDTPTSNIHFHTGGCFIKSGPSITGEVVGGEYSDVIVRSPRALFPVFPVHAGAMKAKDHLTVSHRAGGKRCPAPSLPVVTLLSASQ